MGPRLLTALAISEEDFVVETLFTEPDLFDTYIAYDPSLWWDRGGLVERAAARIEATAGRSLYLASRDQSEIAALRAFRKVFGPRA